MFGRSLRPHARNLREPWQDSAFTPAQLKSFGLMIWYRADLGVTLNSGNVSALADQSGAGDSNRNLTQGTAANQPPWTASDPNFNGRSSIGPYNNTTHTLPSAGVWSTAPPSTGTLFAVFKTGGSGVEAMTCDPNHSNEYEFYQNTTTSAHFFMQTTDTGVAVANMNNVHIYGLDINGGGPTWAISQDAITPAGSAATDASSIATSLTLGRQGAYSGTWAEFILCNQRLSASLFAQTMRYLGSRYKIAIGP